jgi:IMP dehydrogenase
MNNRFIPVPLGGFHYENLSIIPRISEVRPQQVDISSRITKNIKTKFPFMASPMDSVINYSLSVSLLREGGVPILHPFYGDITKLKKIVNRLEKVRDETGGKIGLLVSPKKEYLESVMPILKCIDIVAIDSLHQEPHLHLQAVSQIKEQNPELDIISGNVVFGEDCEKLILSGVDAVRVGMTDATINIGQELTGCGRYQGSSVYECSLICKKYNIPLIADGGVKRISHAAIALALGADTVMMGSLFASVKESGSKLIKGNNGNLFKVYKGMSRSGLISEEMIPEGIEKRMPLSDCCASMISQWSTIIKLTISRAGCKSLFDFGSSTMLEYHI